MDRIHHRNRPDHTEKRSITSHSMYENILFSLKMFEMFLNVEIYSSSVLDFIYHANKLLDLEKQAEADEAALSSKTYRYVQVEEYTMGCNGRCNVKLIMKSGSSAKVVTDFAKVGESVTLKVAEGGSDKKENEVKVVRGVISVVTDKYIIATMDEFLDEWYEASKLLMNKVLDEVTFKRLEMALKHLEHYEKTPASNIVNLCFRPMSDDENEELLPKFVEDREIDQMTFFSTTLNDSQKDAIKFALKSNDMALILGPPGTGKVSIIFFENDAVYLNFFFTHTRQPQ